MDKTGIAGSDKRYGCERKVRRSFFKKQVSVNKLKESGTDAVVTDSPAAAL